MLNNLNEILTRAMKRNKEAVGILGDLLHKDTSKVDYAYDELFSKIRNEDEILHWMKVSNTLQKFTSEISHDLETQVTILAFDKLAFSNDDDVIAETKGVATKIKNKTDVKFQMEDRIIKDIKSYVSLLKDYHSIVGRIRSTQKMLLECNDG